MGRVWEGPARMRGADAVAESRHKARGSRYGVVGWSLAGGSMGKSRLVGRVAWSSELAFDGL